MEPREDRCVGKKFQPRKVFGREVDCNPAMVWTRSNPTAEECLEGCVTPVQKEVYCLIEEFWKRFGCGPTYRELAQLRKSSCGNVKRVVDRLVAIGVVKRVANMDRSVRPSYMAFKRGEFE